MQLNKVSAVAEGCMVAVFVAGLDCKAHGLEMVDCRVHLTVGYMLFARAGGEGYMLVVLWAEGYKAPVVVVTEGYKLLSELTVTVGYKLCVVAEGCMTLVLVAETV